VSLELEGNMYHAGLTQGAIFSPQQGAGDVYLVKLSLEKTFMTIGKQVKK